MANKTNRRAMKQDIKMEFTPMIDCVFLLLIFFMCTLKFKTLEGKLATYLPTDKGLNTHFEQLEPVEKIRIKLSLRGAECGVFINGQYLGILPGVEKRVYERIRQLKAASDKSPAEIDPDPRVPHKHVVAVVDECMRARLKEITFTGALPELTRR
ncbi:MAG: biopolymer transporter ExbD [Planctomycetes bacterium]|nr:biopolymer transporter ExbD [Planctomycetota bacterium]